jgi:hypothetical protein
MTLTEELHNVIVTHVDRAGSKDLNEREHHALELAEERSKLIQGCPGARRPVPPQRAGPGSP